MPGSAPVCISQVLCHSYYLFNLQFVVLKSRIFGRNLFGRLLHLAEFTLAAWQALCHNNVHCKMADPEHSDTLQMTVKCDCARV